MSFDNNLRVMDEQELNRLNVTFQLLSFRNILLRGKLMQVADFSYSLLIFGYRHHFSRMFPHPPTPSTNHGKSGLGLRHPVLPLLADHKQYLFVGQTEESVFQGCQPGSQSTC